ncbi:MAG: ATP-binding cassette domain-containing protein [Thermovirgaceae bacterium]|jgi:cell division transport system ATP-binding protein|nr:ATP-binding cassette domain-containing protein [Synergistales bacterium]MDI9393480.1 ATP-binding cassette domain-containing protein [Synergistota bacterium]NLV65586.1 ATP-binding cassette domain-containing protein [Synergistaceae bacterium]HRW87325.1 ATP-binding cassette domain-containing protein [Thermovirgaceae bacterium]MDD3830781.1 ATP-binding cassette domain-containing protein [Synergistales bacterium]
MEIRFAGVTKQFLPDIVALQDIFLTIEKGEFVYLVGPTGSGKTTLLRLVTRELVPTKGRVTVGDVNIRKIASHNLAYLRRNIGVVFQDFRLLPDLTVYENIAFVQEVIGVSSHDVQKRTNDVLDRLGLWRRRSLFPEQLSGGEQQRVAIGRAIANSPSILLADEPTGNLDIDTADEIMQLLLSINASGTTLIVATHNQYIVDSYRQRVIELRKGRLVRDEKKGRYRVDGDF